MPVNAGKRHFWEYCPRRYLPANTAGKCHRPTLVKSKKLLQPPLCRILDGPLQPPLNLAEFGAPG